jgi:hypothetical protein
MRERLPRAQDLREGLTALETTGVREGGGDALDVEDGPLDWLGNPVSCADCPYDETRAAGRCDLGRVCIMDRRARRIDRFFAANPAQAERLLAHPYFEMRALAARAAWRWRDAKRRRERLAPRDDFSSLRLQREQRVNEGVDDDRDRDQDEDAQHDQHGEDPPAQFAAR